MQTDCLGQSTHAEWRPNTGMWSPHHYPAEEVVPQLKWCVSEEIQYLTTNYPDM